MHIISIYVHRRVSVSIINCEKFERVPHQNQLHQEVLTMLPGLVSCSQFARLFPPLFCQRH